MRKIKQRLTVLEVDSVVGIVVVEAVAYCNLDGTVRAVGKAMCNFEAGDVFDYDFGVRLATARAEKKLMGKVIKACAYFKNSHYEGYKYYGDELTKAHRKLSFYTGQLQNLLLEDDAKSKSEKWKSQVEVPPVKVVW